MRVYQNAKGVNYVDVSVGRLFVDVPGVKFVMVDSVGRLCVFIDLPGIKSGMVGVQSLILLVTFASRTEFGVVGGQTFVILTFESYTRL